MEKKTAAKKTAPKKTAAKAEKTEKKATHHAEGHESAPKAAKAKKAAPRKAAAASGKSCKVKGCKRHYRAKGYCKSHYRQWRHGKFAKARFKRCHDYGCTKPMAMNRHGYCEEHFVNFYVKGMEVTHAPAAPAPKKEEKAAETAA